MPEQPQLDWSAHKAFAHIAAVQTAVGWILMDDFDQAAEALDALPDDILVTVGSRLSMLNELGDEILVERGFDWDDTGRPDGREEWKP